MFGTIEAVELKQLNFILDSHVTFRQSPERELHRPSEGRQRKISTQILRFQNRSVKFTSEIFHHTTNAANQETAIYGTMSCVM